MHEMQPVRQQQQLVAVQGEFEPGEAELPQLSEETKFTPIISTGDNMNVKTAGQTEDTLLRNGLGLLCMLFFKNSGQNLRLSLACNLTLLILYVQEVVTHFCMVTYYIIWVTTSWTHSITINIVQRK